MIECALRHLAPAPASCVRLKLTWYGINTVATPIAAASSQKLALLLRLQALLLLTPLQYA